MNTTRQRTDQEEFWKFTDEKMKAVKNTDLPDLLEHLGYHLKRTGRYYTTTEMDSLMIKNRRTWKRYSSGKGGDAITFLQEFENMGFREAVNYLLEFNGRTAPAISDPELDGQERFIVALTIFYPNSAEMPPEHYQEAVDRCMRFVRGGMGEEPAGRSPKLVDWEQDFQHIVAPVNRVLGREVRAVEYMHWWTFLAAFYEIGDCTFAQIVRVRDRQARGKALDKLDREWYRENRHLVDFKRKYTRVEDDMAKSWGF